MPITAWVDQYFYCKASLSADKSALYYVLLLVLSIYIWLCDYIYYYLLLSNKNNDNSNIHYQRMLSNFA